MGYIAKELATDIIAIHQLNYNSSIEQRPLAVIKVKTDHQLLAGA